MNQVSTLLGSCLSPKFGLNFLLFIRLSTARYFGVNWCAVVVRLCVCGALIERSACSYVYRWVNIFTRPVPVYALVDGYVNVYVYAPVNVYVAVAVHIYVHISACPSIYPSIHLCTRAENWNWKSRPSLNSKFNFQNRNPKSNFRFAFEIEIRIPKLFFKNLLTKFNLCGIIYMCLSGTIHFVKEIH